MSNGSALTDPPAVVPLSRTSLTGLRVLGLLVGFFGIIFAVNFFFAYRAVSTYSGDVANEPFAQGVAYNRRIEAAERQSKLGWVDTVSLALNGEVSVRMTDASGHGVANLALIGTLDRPSTSRDDRALAFSDKGDGLYVARTSAVQAGAWIVDLAVKHAGATDAPVVYQSRRRVWLTP